MGRRRFDHFYIELCCALNVRLPRYPLWLELGESAGDPERLERNTLLAFLDSDLDRFLARQGLRMGNRRHTRLRRVIERFDPATPSPAEVFARMSSATAPA